MNGLVTAYRVLAFVVGILLAFGALVALPLKYLLTDGTTLQQLGEDASFVLARRAGWCIPFTLLALVGGMVPLLIFWVEHRVMQKLRAENPDLAPSAL